MILIIEFEFLKHHNMMVSNETIKSTKVCYVGYKQLFLKLNVVPLDMFIYANELLYYMCTFFISLLADCS